MSLSLGQILIHFVGDTTDVDSALERTASEATSWGSRLSSLLGGAFQTAGGILMAQGVEATWGAIREGLIGTNASLETSTLQFQTLMGDAARAEEHVRGLFDFAKRTPFETGPVIEASRYMQTFGGDALNTEQNLTLLGDASAATGQKINEVSFWVSRAYDAMMSGKPWGESAMRLQEMGVMSGTTRARLEDLTKSGADGTMVWAALQEELGKFSGAMALQADTWTGLTSSLSDMVNLNLASVFSPIFELLKDGARSILAFGETDMFAGLVESGAAAMQRIADAVRSVASVVMEFVTTAAPYLVAAWEGISQAASVAGVLWDQVTSALDSAFSGVLSAAGSWGEGVVAAFASGISAGVGYVTSALGGIADTVSYWLTPGSPPPLLPNLDKWGAGAASAYMDGWSEADFNGLSQFGSTVSDVLGNLVSAGAMDGGASNEMMLGLRNGFAGLLNELTATGQVSEESFAAMEDAAGPAGKEVGRLARDYVQLTKAARDLEEAQAALEGIEDEMASARADLAIAQARGDAGLAASARNRYAQLATVRKEATEKKNAAAREKKAAEDSIKLQKLQIQAQKEQLALLRRIADEQKKANTKGKDTAKAAAEAQWRYVYSLQDTDGKIRMLREKLAGLTQDQAEYWQVLGQIDQLEKQKAKEQEDAAKQAQKDAQKTADEAEKLADAQFANALAAADNAGKVELLKGKLAGLNDDSVEYWQTLTQLQAAERALAKEREAAAKKGGGGPAAGGPPTPPERPATPQDIVDGVVDQAKAAAVAAEMAARAQAEAGARRVRQVLMGIFGPVIGMAQQAWSQIRQPVETGLTTIRDTISSRSSEIAATFIFTWTTMASIVTTRVMDIWRIVQLVLGIIAQVVVQYGPTIANNFITAWLQIQRTVVVVLAAVNQVIHQVLGIVATFLQQNGDSIVATIGGAWALILQIIGGVATIVGTLVSVAFMGISQFLTEHGDQILYILTTAWDLISSVVMGALQLIAGLVQVVMTGLSGDWSGAWQLLQTVSAQAVLNIWQIILNTLNLIAAFFDTSLAEIGELWQSNWNALVGILVAVWTLIVTTIQTTWTRIQTDIQTAVTNVVTSVTTGMTNVASAVASGVQDTISGIASFIADFTQFGANIVQGIIDGVLSMAGALFDSITGLVDDMLAAGQDAAETGSPSRRFRDELGVTIPQGVAEGIDQETPTAVASMQRTVDDVAAVAAPALQVPFVSQVATGAAAAAMGAAGAAAGGAPSPGAGQPITIIFENVTVASEVDMQQLAYTVAREIQRRNR